MAKDHPQVKVKSKITSSNGGWSPKQLRDEEEVAEGVIFLFIDSFLETRYENGLFFTASISAESNRDLWIDAIQGALDDHSTTTGKFKVLKLSVHEDLGYSSLGGQESVCIGVSLQALKNYTCL